MNQIPVAFGAGFFLQYFVPSLAVALALVPLHPARAEATRLDAFVLLVIGVAVFFMLFSPLTANVIFGELFPSRYKRRAQDRLARRLERAKTLMGGSGESRRLQAFVQNFPLDKDRNPHVITATLYGNASVAQLLKLGGIVPGEAGDEAVYVRGIVRSWYLLDSEIRKDLERLVVQVQATLLSSFGLGAVALLYEGLFLIRVVGSISDGSCVHLAVGCALATSAPYLAGAIGCALLAHLAHDASLVNLNSLVVAFAAVRDKRNG